MSRIHVAIVDEPINLSALVHSDSSFECGAESIFIGKVRNHNLGRSVLSVTYDAFSPLTENIFRQLAEEACEKFEQRLSVTILHRVGSLSVGEVSIAIRVESPHRVEAFSACRFLIEQIKLKAPIWKKEFYEDGESEWVKGHALCQHEAPRGDDSCWRQVDSHEARQSTS